MSKFKKSSPAGKLLNKMESASSKKSITIDGEKYASYGEYVEELSDLVKEKDEEKFFNILEKYWPKNTKFDEPIMEVVDEIDDNKVKELVAELQKLSYDKS